MKQALLFSVTLGLVVVLAKCANPHDAFVEDNDFAEFEEFDEEEEGKT